MDTVSVCIWPIHYVSWEGLVGLAGKTLIQGAYDFSRLHDLCSILREVIGEGANSWKAVHRLSGKKPSGIRWRSSPLQSLLHNGYCSSAYCRKQKILKNRLAMLRHAFVKVAAMFI